MAAQADLSSDFTAAQTQSFLPNKSQNQCGSISSIAWSNFPSSSNLVSPSSEVQSRRTAETTKCGKSWSVLALPFGILAGSGSNIAQHGRPTHNELIWLSADQLPTTGTRCAGVLGLAVAPS